MRSTSRGALARASLLFLAVALASQSRAQTLVNVTYPGADYTGAYGINNHDVVVGTYLLPTGSPHAFMLSQGTFSNIDFPSSFESLAYRINDRGVVVGTYADATGNKGFILNSGSYTSISFPGSVATDARGINNAGQIVGFYTTSDGKFHGYEFTNGVYTALDCPCGQTLFEGINNLGLIVGYYIDANNLIHGLEYTAGSFSTFDYPGLTTTYLNDINDSGVVVGTAYDAASQASIGFRDLNGQLFPIRARRPNQNVDYLGINDSGQIVGSEDYFTNTGTGLNGNGFFLSSGPFAYVGNVTSPNCCTLTVLDTQTNLVAATITVGYGGVPFGVSPDQTRIYLANGNTVQVVDTTTNSIVATVPGVGPNANAVTIAPNGNFGYTANVGSVSVFSTSSNTVVATVPVGFPAGYVTVTPDGLHLYVSGTGSTIAVINTSTNQVESTFSIPVPPGGLNADFGPFLLPNGSFGYVGQDVALVTPGTVTAITIPGNQTVATIPVGTQPAQIAVSPDGGYVYVANSGSNDVSVINTSSNQVIATIPVGKDPSTLAITPDGSLVYVGNFTDSSLSVIQTSTNSVVATIPVASPSGIVIPSSTPASQAITQPLSPTSPNQFNFGPHSFTVQYPAGTNFSGVDMTVVAAQTTQASFKQRTAGTAFANATCIIYSGTGGNCVDYQVTCSDTNGNTISCPSTSTPTISVKTSFDTQQQIINPGFLYAPIGTNNWSNIFESFFLQRIDPTVKGRTRGFSQFVAVELGTSNEQGAAQLQFLWPLRQQDKRAFPAGRVIPVSFKLTSISRPGEPVTDARAGASVQMVTDANGNPVSTSVLEGPVAIEYEDGFYHFALDTRHFAVGTYVLTVYGDAFAAQQVQFTITQPIGDEDDE